MALVHHYQHIIRKIVQQAVGWRAGFTTVEVAAVVLHARAVAELLNHLDIVVHALVYALGLQLQSFVMEIGYLVIQIFLYLLQRTIDTLLTGAEDRGGIDVDEVKLLN